MKISYNWLQEYFEKPLPNPKELADLLNVRAFEVEEVEEKDGDSILEIKITPDRAPDCLSHEGVAREVSVHTQIPLLKNEEVADIAANFDTEHSVNAEDKSCQRYMAREIRSVVVGESPLELKTKLEVIGQRPINTIVDITNIVMYEIGQPMHAFDADKVSGKTITIGMPKNSHITTLDGKEIELTEEDLTIQDESDNLAIAGVKGGNKAEVNSATTNIILESANFFPIKVRKASKRTGIQTDSSKRFENGLTPVLAERAIMLASLYIQKYASSDKTQFSNIIDTYPRPQHRPYSVGMKVENVVCKLGAEISEQEVLNILTRAGIKYHKVESIGEIRDLVPSVLNAPYSLGASVLLDAPKAFDCSSLMAYLYGFVGIQIPRISVDQYVFGKEVSESDLSFGDLVFSNSNNGTIHHESKEFLPGTKVEAGVDHVGMYLGDGKILHASRHQENGTVIEELAQSKQFANIVGYRRIAGEKDFPRYVLEIPYERFDLRKEVDIIEEIGRIYGYEHIVPTPPTLAAQEIKHTTYDKLTAIRSHLIDLGFDEVVTYSFQKKGDISVIKPLASDKASLRPNLQKGMTDALDLNFRNRELFASDVVKIFEVGHVFTESGEKLVLGLGAKSAAKKQKTKDILHGALETLNQKLGLTLATEVKDNQEIVEIELDTLFENITDTHDSLYSLPATPYVPFSPYPFMTRDIAVWANASKTKSDIEKVITDLATNLLLRYDLFDEFSKDGKTSYAYRLVFQSSERTLTDDEINPIMDSIYDTLKADSDFEIR